MIYWMISFKLNYYGMLSQFLSHTYSRNLVLLTCDGFTLTETGQLSMARVEKTESKLEKVGQML